MLLSEYDIIYVTQKAIKGSALIDFLAHQPVKDYQPMQPNFPDEDISTFFHVDEFNHDENTWTLFFDGASNVLGHAIRAVLITPDKQYIPMTTRLSFDCTNNVA